MDLIISTQKNKEKIFAYKFTFIKLLLSIRY